jgi:hypothetical protein
VGAKEEDADATARLDGAGLPGSVGAILECRMEALAGGEIEMLDTVEIQAVIDVSAIGRAAALRDERLVPKLAKMVGDEVRRLAHELDELLDPAVAPGERLHELPAQLMRQELEEREGLGKSHRRHDRAI